MGEPVGGWQAESANRTAEKSANPMRPGTSANQGPCQPGGRQARCVGSCTPSPISYLSCSSQALVQ